MPLSKDVYVGEFLYPDGHGEYRKADSITVTETTNRTRRIDARMTHVVMRGILGLSNSLRPDSQSSDSGESEEMDDEAVLTFLAMGIEDSHVYEQTLDAIRKALTSEPRLAVVSGTEVPLTDEIWGNIGLENETRVLSVFASFFLARMQKHSRKTNGSNGSIASSSPTRVGSPSLTPPIIPNAN